MTINLLPNDANLIEVTSQITNIKNEIINLQTSLVTNLNNKGVECSTDDKMSTLIDKVGSIATGKKWASISTTIDIRDITTSEFKFKTIPINVDFIPSEVFVTIKSLVSKNGSDLTYRPLYNVTVSSKSNYSYQTSFSAGGMVSNPYKFYITNITNSSFDFNYYSYASNAPTSVTEIEINIYGN